MASINDELLPKKASALEDAARKWEEAVSEVQDALSDMDNLDEDHLPEEILNLIQEAREEEPDLGAPQQMLYQAQEIVRLAEELADSQEEEEEE